jgi:hypothetical protein
MSRVLSHIVGKPMHEVAKIVGELENKYGYPSHDVRVLADSIPLSRKKHQELGLDPDDTTPEELYHALLARYDSDCKRLDQALGLDQHSSVQQKFQKAQALIKSKIGNQELWALKRTSAKELLRTHPPKKLMKALGYRSLESLLKREDVASIFMLAQSVESEAWHTQTAKLIKSQNTTNFERRAPNIVAINADPGDSGLVLYDQALASVGLITTSTHTVSSLSICLLAANGLEKLGIKVSLTDVDSSLNFWQDTHGLFCWKEPEAISLNLHDAARNHVESNSFKDRKQDSGAQNFWQDLVNRYGQGVESLENAEQNLSSGLDQLVNLPEPAVEYEFAQENL